MKPRQSLCALFVAAWLAATCAGAVGAAPMSASTSIYPLRNGTRVNDSIPTPPGTWFGQYYDNMFLQGQPDVAREDAAIDFDWGDGSPDPRISADYFSVRWTRSLWLGTGTWRFTTTTDDGVRLWVDNIVVVNQWHDQPAATYMADVPLKAGYHSIIVEYFDLNGAALARLSYQLWRDSCENCLPAIQAGPWLGQYYDNMLLEGDPSVTRDDAAIDFDWDQGAPDPRISQDWFSARWTRNLWLNTGTWRFTTTTDDGVRLWVDNTLLVDEWHEQPAMTYSADVLLGAGYHAIRMEYFDSLGYAVARLSVELLNAPCANCPGPWSGQYYDNVLPQGGPDVARTDAALDFDWDNGSPDPRIPKDFFSARWTQTAHFDAGIYRFHAIADDGVRLYVDGQVVIDEWGNNPGAELTSDVKLRAGNHAVKVEYYEYAYDARIKVWWEKLD